jgi:PBP1b-binding outer membrane lipoprotein LpoB
MSVLKDVKDFFSIAWQVTTVRWLTIIAVIILIATFMHGCSMDSSTKKYEQQISQWKTSATIALQKNTVAQHQVDSLLQDSKSKDSKIAVLLTASSKLQNTQAVMRLKDDSTLNRLKAQLPDTCLVALALAEQYRTEGDLLRGSLSLEKATEAEKDGQIVDLKKSVGIEQLQNDSLRTVILNVPVYKPEKVLGFIPLPSRKQSFVVGAVLGVVGAATAILSIHK